MNETTKLFAGINNASAIIKLNGHVTFKVAPSIREYEDVHIEEILSSKQLLFDLTECTFLDSTILGLITHLSIAYFKKNNSRACFLYTEDKIMRIAESINIQLFLNMVYIDDNNIDCQCVSEIGSSSEVSSTELRNIIRDAHEVLFELCDENKEIFREVIKNI